MHCWSAGGHAVSSLAFSSGDSALRRWWVLGRLLRQNEEDGCSVLRIRTAPRGGLSESSQCVGRAEGLCAGLARAIGRPDYNYIRLENKRRSQLPGQAKPRKASCGFALIF